MEFSQDILQQERVDTKERLLRLTEVGGPIFAQTAFVQDRNFAQDDIGKVKQFFEASKPFVHPNLWPVYWEHVELVGAYARTLGEMLKDKGVEVNPHELEALGMIHDIGRIISPHRYFRTNFVGDALLKKLGVREEIIAKQVPEVRLFGKGGGITDSDQLSISQQILLLADNLGRRTEDGSLISFDQIADLTEEQEERYQGEVFPSERFGKKNLRAVSSKVLKLLEQIRQKFESEHGISLDGLRSEVVREIESGS